MSGSAKAALIVGGSRGLGLGLVREFLDRGWHVVATTRNPTDAALRDVAETGRLRIERLDVNDPVGLASLREALAGTALDVLFVSAGVLNEGEDSAATTPPEAFNRVMLTNALAPAKIIAALGDGVAARGVIVAMTSILGSVAGNTSGGNEIYRASKAALNSLLRSYAAAHPGRAIVAMHPGWVRTDMGGANADVGVEESACGIVDVVLGRAGQAGCVFVDHRGQTIAW